MIKAAIFDVDGVIMDTMPLLKPCGAHYLRTLGITPQEDLSERLRYMSFMQACEVMKEEYALLGSAEEIYAELGKYLVREYLKCPAKPGVKEALEYFAENGVRMALATANAAELVAERFRMLGIDGYFEDIITVDGIGTNKDQPDVYRLALAATGADKRDAVVFEDSMHGIRTAKADGFIVAGVRDDSEDWQEVCRAADYQIEDWSRVRSVFF